MTPERITALGVRPSAPAWVSAGERRIDIRAAIAAGQEEGRALSLVHRLLRFSPQEAARTGPREAAVPTPPSAGTDGVGVPMKTVEETWQEGADSYPSYSAGCDGTQISCLPTAWAGQASRGTAGVRCARP